MQGVCCLLPTDSNRFRTKEPKTNNGGDLKIPTSPIGPYLSFNLDADWCSSSRDRLLSD